MVSTLTPTWTTFHCNNADFTVRSAFDGGKFAANRHSLQASEVLRGMFSLSEIASQEDQVVDIHETSDILAIFLYILHFPLDPVYPQPIPDGMPDGDSFDTKAIIPLPILLTALHLVNKYAVSESITEVLYGHLIAHASSCPLRIYGYALSQNLPIVASEASQYVMPIASYTSQDIKDIPNVEGYHKIVRLQDCRVKELRAVVLNEDIFPHGYGLCSSHNTETRGLWELKCHQLASYLNSVTDVAAEMGTIAEALPKGCPTCMRAYVAALEMLAYKSRRILRRIDELPSEI